MTITVFEDDGYAITGPLFDAGSIATISSAVSQLEAGAAGTRNLLALPWCADLADQMRRHPHIVRYIDRTNIAVQCTYFEKSSDRNWLVPLHQDLSIPVSERMEQPELAGWSIKEGTVFVQPPDDVLETMVAVRLHLDDCGIDDGPLRVVPGSHRHGRLSADETAARREHNGEFVCVVERGGALVMKPLLLHASSKARGNSRRRVLHFVYGPPVLPHGLHWKIAV